MFENYLYCAHQSVMAPRWSKVRRGLLLSIWYPNGRKLALYTDGMGHYGYLSVGNPVKRKV